MSMIDLYKGDCLEVMDELIARGIVVDAIITDPPYGTTACKWDSIIQFDFHVKQGNQVLNKDEYILEYLKHGIEYKEALVNWEQNKKEGMWTKLNKLIKPNGAIVLFGSEPFSSALRMSNIKNYKYDWVWDKVQPTGMPLVKKMPMKQHEIISIFYSKQPTYNRQMIDRPKKDIRVNAVKNKLNQKTNSGYDHNGIIVCKYADDYDPTKVNPKSIITFSKQPKRVKNVHPTQKPTALMEYLIKTYTNENELVLDFTMGSGTTGVACKKLNRNFIGIEMDDKYFEIAKKRIEDTVIKKGLFDEKI